MRLYSGAIRMPLATVCFVVTLALHGPDAHAQAVPEGPSAVIHVATPVGEAETDRGSILEALQQARPGDTVQFAAGTYLVGPLIPVTTPGLVLLGHADGTTLRGCEPAAYDRMERDAALAFLSPDPEDAWRAVSRCGTLELTGGHVTIRDFTIEYSRLGLILGCCAKGGEFRATPGGYRIEGNTFRNTGNSIRTHLASSQPTVIRRNRFINAFHVLSADVGSHLHVIENEITVPEPEQVPGMGHPGFAMVIGGMAAGPAEGHEDAPSGCEHNVVAGNRIDGHPDGILIVAPPGGACRHNVIRDNTIAVRRVRHPVPWVYAALVPEAGPADSTFVGVPLGLLGLADGTAPAGAVTHSVVEGNRILGAEGVGVEILHGSSNQIVKNTVRGVTRRDPFPGRTVGFPPSWGEANGAGIWLSPGSDGNEIKGNAFDAIASDAVVIQGDGNRVEPIDPGDGVRDLGSGNLVGTTEPAAHGVDALVTRFIRALNDETIRFLAPFYAPDAVLVGGEGEVLTGRASILEDFFRPVVARVRGVERVSSRIVADDDVATVVTTYTARLAPATEPGQGVFTTTWRRQPDDGWLIVAGTFELPRYEPRAVEGPIRSGFFHSDGLRLHYVDFGGEGVPLVFVHSGDRTGYTFMEFAPGFTDRNRVLAISQRGAGLSEGVPAPRVPRAILARDIITMLDSLALERAVVVGQWGDLLIHLAEEYPHRMAGLVFLESHGLFEPDAAVQEQDPIDVLRMLELNRAALWGGVPEPADSDPDPGNRYLRPASTIDVPALSFVGEASSAEDMWDEILGLARLAERSATLFPDPRIRAYFQRLASDEAMQDQGWAFWRDVVAPSLRAGKEALERAFGDRLRSVPVEPRAIGYGYRDTPELIEPHIRRFLEAVVGPAADTVHVAPPTGQRDRDRASILAAVERVQPGGTVQFAPGTYLVGDGIRVTTPRVTLLGHRDGTALRGCDPATITDLPFLASNCNGLELEAGHQTVRDITFEHAYVGIYLGPGMRGTTPVAREGGDRVEGNTFRTGYGVIAEGGWADPSIIRGNRFINTFHGIGIAGGTIHLLSNHFAVPQPELVLITGFPSDAVMIAPRRRAPSDTLAPTCGRNVVAGNHIEGSPYGIQIAVFEPGSTCSGTVVRENTIEVRRVRSAAPGQLVPGFGWTDETDSTFVGVPIVLHNYTVTSDPTTDTAQPGVIEYNLIEGNRVIGTEGPGMHLHHASRNRIVNNTFTDIRVRHPFPGHTIDRPELGPAANGAGIWVSPGSDANEILGNTFEDIAGHAVVLEGGSNIVETLSAADRVRDLGTHNRVSTGAAAQDVSQPTHETRSIRVDGERLQYLDFGGAGLPVLFTAGARPAETWAGFAPRFADRHRVIAITHRGVPPSEGQETGYAQSARDILALLDSLGFERAVLVGNSNPAPVLIYIAEHYPERVTGLVFLAPASEAGLETVEDPSGAMQMVERAFLSTQGRDPDEAGGLDDGHLYRPRYFESGSPGISIPALTFVNRDGARGLERVIYPLQVAEIVAAGTLQIPDSVARSYFERLAADSDMQRDVRAAWNTVMAAPMIANEQAFFRAFGESLRIVPLDVPLMDGVPVVTGYEYRDSPDLIEAHIRQFLEEVSGGEQRRSGPRLRNPGRRRSLRHPPARRRPPRAAPPVAGRCRRRPFHGSVGRD